MTLAQKKQRLQEIERDSQRWRDSGVDADLKDIRRRKKINEMRYSTDGQLALMRERRRLQKAGIGLRGDAQSLAAEYRSAVGNQPERREYRTSLSVDAQNRIVGYAAVFGSLSEPMKFGNRSFRERILPGAFDRCLRSNPDVRGLINHDPSLLLGRTLAGTMRVSADAHGLRYEIDAPDTSYSRDLLVSMKRRDLDSSSFGFFTDEDNWLEDASGGTIREIVAARVFDCSPVTFPAYPAATSGVA